MKRNFVLASAITLAFLAGCQPSATNQLDSSLIEKYQSQIVLSEEPAAAVGIDELRTQLLGDRADESASATISTDEVDVVLLGRVGGGTSGDTALGSDYPWDKGRAAFVITDPSMTTVTAESELEDADHTGESPEGDEHAGHENHQLTAAESEADHAGHDHAAHEHAEHDHSAHGDDHHDCPFCNKAKAAAAQAIVQFVGEDGEPLPIDARELFDLDGDELVVVTGKARLTVGMLMVTAEKIYVRR